MSKSKRAPGYMPMFYKSVKDAKEIRTGYLLKSPPRLKSEKSWKNRYFVLYKVNEHEHYFMYFRSPEKMDKPLGEINLAQISILQLSPQSHPRLNWIQNYFKCPPSNVLYIRSEDRDYFLVGETSDVMDCWFSDLAEATKHKAHKVHSLKEMPHGNNIKVISNPLLSRRHCDSAAEKQRSFSDPSSNKLESILEKPTDAHHTSRRASMPVPYYDFPQPLRRPITGGNDQEDLGQDQLYETMTGIGENPLRGELKRFSEYSTSSSDNDLISPCWTVDKHSAFPLDKRSSLESSPEERNITVKQADLKKHLTVTDVDGKPSVSGWTGQQQTGCLFHKGDQILAINDLLTSSLKELNLYLSNSLKNEVTVTILRLPGSQPLHFPNCLCIDW